MLFDVLCETTIDPVIVCMFSKAVAEVTVLSKYSIIIFELGILYVPVSKELKFIIPNVNIL